MSDQTMGNQLADAGRLLGEAFDALAGAFNAFGDALALGYRRALERQQRDQRVVAMIEGGYLYEVGDTEALEVLRRHYADSPMKHSEMVGKYFTARAHTQLSFVERRYASPVITFDGILDGSRIASGSIVMSGGSR